MATNKIIKYNLKSKAIALKNEGKTPEEISTILTKDSKMNISSSSVRRFFESHEKEVLENIQKNEMLQAKVAEVEINTINDWLDDIKLISDLAADAWSAGDYRAAAMAIKIKVEARESVNKQLGRLNNNSNVTINNINAMKLSDIPTELLQRWREEAHGMRG